MSKIIRLCAIVVVIAIIMTGVTGCMFDGKDNKTVSSRKMVKYLEDKYGEKFTCVGSSGAGLVGGEVKIRVTTDSLPGAEITVGYSLVDGEACYTENYLAHTFENQTVEYIRELCVKALGCDVIVVYNVPEP